MLRVVHKKKEAKPRKPLPMDKDPKFLAELRRDIIRDHNQKIDRLRAEGKIDW